MPSAAVMVGINSVEVEIYEVLACAHYEESRAGEEKVRFWEPIVPRVGFGVKNGAAVGLESRVWLHEAFDSIPGYVLHRVVVFHAGLRAITFPHSPLLLDLNMRSRYQELVLKP